MQTIWSQQQFYILQAFFWDDKVKEGEGQQLRSP